MPLDAICMQGLAEELRAEVQEGRIEKIYQPSKDALVLSVRSRAGRYRLLIETTAQTARMQFVEEIPENPATPPMFCMLLRKYIGGAKILALMQPRLERMLTFELECTDELGVFTKRYLHCELMGRGSNVILTDEEGRIIDALKRVEGDLIQGKRQVLPGLFYRAPSNLEERLDVSTITKQGLQQAIVQNRENIELAKWVLSHFRGFSPLLCREIAYQATGDAHRTMAELTEKEQETLASTLVQWGQTIAQGGGKPYLLCKAEDGSFLDFASMPITQYGSAVQCAVQSSFSSMLGLFYEKRTKEQNQKRRTQELTQMISKKLDRLTRKMAAQAQELLDTQQKELDMQKGELLTANLHVLQRGMQSVTLPNYYVEGMPDMVIALNPLLTPQQNAQQYYKRYKKAKVAEQILKEQLQAGTQEKAYLESVLQALDDVETEQDVLEIKEELMQTKYLGTSKKGKKTSAKAMVFRPYHYRTTDGFDVFVGKNNLQNDQLTLKQATKRDVWFHTQKIQGAHVILSLDGRDPTDLAMTQAAQIAAYHSKGKHSAMVPVDYTEVRNIKKPSGAKPGMVIYHVYQTAYVTPEEKEIENLRVQ